MSTVKTNSVILGQSATDTNNFLLDTDAAGALRIRRRSDGSGGTLLNIPVGGTTRQLAQIQTFQTGAVATGTAIIPRDDTIPQITEGNEYMTLAITPINAGSTLEIDVLFEAAASGGNYVTVALFQDATANALAAINGIPGSSGYTQPLAFKHLMTAGTTSATTFRIRAGLDVSGTTTFNGSGGARLLGGVMASRITIKEYLP